MNRSRRIAEGLARRGIVSPDDIEICAFGVGQLLFQAVNVATAAGVGLLCNMLPQCLFFLAAYIPLRSFAGGFHAKTQLRCYVLSNLLLMAALSIIYLAPATIWNCLLLTAPGACLIFLLAPVPDRNKPLSGKEHLIYRRKARCILLALIALSAGSFVVSVPVLAMCIGAAISTLSIMVLLGLLKNRLYAPEPGADGNGE